MGEVAKILELFLNFSHSVRIVLDSMLQCTQKLQLQKHLIQKQI